jgi:hypothetical protein
MELAQITPELLECALKQWRQAHDPPAELLTLDLLLDHNAHTPAERSIQLYDYLVTLVTHQLTTYRQAEALTNSPDLPLPRQQLLADLAQDFQVNDATLEAWSVLYYRYLAPLPLTVQELASGAHVEERQIRRRLEFGLRLLTDLVRRAEKEAHERRQARYLCRHLPPPEHTKLFGIEPFVQQIVTLLTAPEQSAFVSIEGLGGIGKTTLARAVTEACAHQRRFQDLLWVQARHSYFSDQGRLEAVNSPVQTTEEILLHLAAQLGLADASGLTTAQLQARLQAVFAQQPHLIVMDNLETLADAQKLLTTLQALAGQSRFLLTSRHTLRYAPFVQTFHVPELSFESSAALMRYEAQRKNQLSPITLPVVEQIYAAIGGLPLAIRLVTTQLGRLPLATILDGLHHARQQLPESMYTHIYRRSWQLLSHDARHLLLAMLFIGAEGEDIGWIKNMSALSEAALQEAITRLADYSLVEIRGCVERPVYRLHRITQTFLQTEVLFQWEKENNAAAITNYPTIPST